MYTAKGAKEGQKLRNRCVENSVPYKPYKVFSGVRILSTKQRHYQTIPLFEGFYPTYLRDQGRGEQLWNSTLCDVMQQCE